MNAPSREETVVRRHSGFRAAAVAAVACAALLAGCERPPMESIQRGFRGDGQVQIVNPRLYEAEFAKLQVPPSQPAAEDGEPRASAAFKNVQVLGDLSVAQFTRVMLSMASWVAPDQGCPYCHKAGDDFSADSLYTKVVARRMLQMTRNINGAWKDHVSTTGVTCYTCHRGQPVPSYVWFKDRSSEESGHYAGWRNQQNAPATTVGLASLPLDPFSVFLKDSGEIRVEAPVPLPSDHHATIQHTEWTYGLMMHFSKALGVNCTYCHNTQQFASWQMSSPARTTAWYGIRMVRHLNGDYLVPLAEKLPAERMGPMGDGPKVNCLTCHQGVYKPLYGVSMLKDYPELAAEHEQPAVAPAAEAAPAAEPETSALPARVLFAVGKKQLSTDGAQLIEAVAKQLKEHPDLHVDVSGFADKTGNPAANLELAKQRAFAVRDALKAAGADVGRIVLKKPEFSVGGTSDDARRVDISEAH
ncbi:MAG TPA: photosynthetic reaction center cytochrome PufC [Burkholderiaceae bacterium]|nr:photosynthetic reaction center cytochrome PufC [Burkholderiaceae bacterium]